MRAYICASKKNRSCSPFLGNFEFPPKNPIATGGLGHVINLQTVPVSPKFTLLMRAQVCFDLFLQLTWTAEMVCKTTGLRRTEEQEIVVSYLPLSHVAAQMIDVWITMKVGAVVYFAQPDALKVSRRG